MDGHPLEQNPQRKSDHAANNAGCHLAFTSFLPPNRAAFSRAGTHRLRRGRGRGGQPLLGGHAADEGICHHLNDGLPVRRVALDSGIKLDDVAALLRGVGCAIHSNASFLVVAPFPNLW